MREHILIGGLHEKVFLRGEIKALTGLAIGGTDQSLAVGGLDKIVLRHPLSNEPYVPGSSLRGKMRCLLERLHGIAGGRHGNMVTFGPCQDPAVPLVQLFGNAAESGDAVPSRLLVRDAWLTEPSRKLLGKLRGELPMTETKTEVCIDRVTSAANPRTFERVPAGAVFAFEMVLEVREVPSEEDTAKWADNEAAKKVRDTLAALRATRSADNQFGRDDDLAMILKGLDLLQDDALGGQGSRGYGRIKVTLSPLTSRSRKDYLEGKDETALDLREDLKGTWERLNARGRDEEARLESALEAIGGWT